MYLDFYGLKEMPFNVTPDPRFLFFTEQHKDAYYSLKYGIEQRKGFITLTGEVGCGKTTICRAVLAGLPKETRSAMILNPRLTAPQLLRCILTDLGIEPKGSDLFHLNAQLNEYLLDCLLRGENVAIFIDEAQDIPPNVLEQIRLLSNLETDQHKLMQLILSGQPEFRKTIRRNEWRQLRQRIMIQCDLKPMTLQEVQFYISHRLKTAGAFNGVGFDLKASRMVHRKTKGIPRMINTLCDRSLMAGYVKGRIVITSMEVKRAVSELKNYL
ncbi:MAG: ATPase [Spartobacteria bacterium]|nr:ATPase [Spartobacteria bacterium]